MRVSPTCPVGMALLSGDWQLADLYILQLAIPLQPRLNFRDILLKDFAAGFRKPDKLVVFACRGCGVSPQFSSSATAARRRSHMPLATGGFSTFSSWQFRYSRAKFSRTCRHGTFAGGFRKTGLARCLCMSWLRRLAAVLFFRYCGETPQPHAASN